MFPGKKWVVACQVNESIGGGERKEMRHQGRDVSERRHQKNLATDGERKKNPSYSKEVDQSWTLDWGNKKRDTAEKNLVQLGARSEGSRSKRRVLLEGGWVKKIFEACIRWHLGEGKGRKG